MKKNYLQIQKALNWLVIMVVLITTVSACTGKNEENDRPAIKTISGEQTDEPITLTVLTTRWGNMGDSFTNNQFLKDLEAKSNVKIEWQVQSLSDWQEQKGIMLASNELPDVIIGNQTFFDTDIVPNLDMFMCLDDLIDDYMPNYKKALEEMPDLRKVTTYFDGKKYSLGKNLPKRPIVCNQPIINKVWLDNLNLDIPTDLEELNVVLMAFKEQDANGNGDPNDEIPITGAKDIPLDLLNPFGITDVYGDMMMIEEDGSLNYYPTSEAYKQGLKWLHELYSEGIIDQEIFTQDDTMLLGKNQDPNISRVGFSYNWIPDAVYGQWSDEYVAIQPIKGLDGKCYAAGDVNGISGISRNEVLISASCQHPEVAARWLDQFYTGEASIQNFWGGIGTVITKKDDGTYILNDPPEGTSADAWYWDQSLRDFGPKYIDKEFEKNIILSSDSGDGLKLKISELAKDYITTPYPRVFFTQEEIEEMAILETELNEFIKVQRVLWLMEGSIDEGWDGYINQLKSIGMDRLIEIKTEAYDRFNQ